MDGSNGRRGQIGSWSPGRWGQVVLAGLAALFFASACGQHDDLATGERPSTGASISVPTGSNFQPLSGPRAPSANACTYPASYWSKHPSGWWHRELQMGATTYSKEEQLAILGRAPDEQGVQNGLVALGQQLIGARLNISAGASPAGLESVLTRAEDLIGGQVIPPRGEGWLPATDTAALADSLLSFNEGRVGPGRCVE